MGKKKNPREVAKELDKKLGPSKDIRDVTLKSIKKKWKDRRFAAGVNREDIETGAAALGISLDEHIAFVLNAMQECAETLGLAGEEHAS